MYFVYETREKDWEVSLEKEVFLNGMEYLSDAFRLELPERTMEVYWTFLHSKFTNNFYRNIVAEIIQKERVFPAIAIFVEYINHSRIDKNGKSRPQV